MDDIDIKIIELLKKNSRLSGSDISKEVHLSVPAVTERIRKLEEGNVIERFTVKLNREKFGLNLAAFIFVTLKDPKYIDNFKKTVMKFDSVLECHHIAGEYDYLLKVVVENTKALERFVSYILKKTEGVSRTNTIITMSSVKETF